MPVRYCDSMTADVARSPEPPSIDLYLNLLRDALTGVLYQDPPCDPWHSVLTSENGAALTLNEGPDGMQIRDPNGSGAPPVVYMAPGTYDQTLREAGRDWPATALTMIGTKRMNQLRDAIETAVQEGVPGDIVECGVWRGGAMIFARGVLQAYRSGRNVILADSFAGLPKPVHVDDSDFFWRIGALRVPVEEVRENFQRYGLLDAQVITVPGFFNASLPGPIKNIAVLRLDGDLYSSTMDALKALYDHLSVGGYCIIDDYSAVRGCQHAVIDFRAERGITDTMFDIDGVGAFWRKQFAS